MLARSFTRSLAPSPSITTTTTTIQLKFVNRLATSVQLNAILNSLLTSKLHCIFCLNFEFEINNNDDDDESNNNTNNSNENINTNRKKKKENNENLLVWWWRCCYEIRWERAIRCRFIMALKCVSFMLFTFSHRCLSLSLSFLRPVSLSLSSHYQIRFVFIIVFVWLCSILYI